MTDLVDLEAVVSVPDSRGLSWPTLRSIGLAQVLRAALARLHLAKIGLFTTSLFLFILAIILMKPFLMPEWSTNWGLLR